MLPDEPKVEDTETQSDIDLTAATAEISADLFGQGKDEDGEDKTPVEGEEAKVSGEDSLAEAPETPPQTIEGEEAKTGEETSEAVQAVGAPSTWTKEAIETWATIPPRAQEEILKREDDMLKGITQYKSAAELGSRYDQVVEPFKPMLAAENIDPVQLFQSFSANHYLLTRGSLQQKVELAANMLNGYEIPLVDLLNYIAENGEVEAPDPKYSALEQRFKALETSISTAQQTETNARLKVLDDEITAFAADPAHLHFNELAADIGKLFDAGLASSLDEAYNKAVFAHPTFRQQEIDRLTAEKLAAAQVVTDKRKDKVAKLTADSVVTTPKSKDGTVPKGSMDDTLAETMAAIEARG